MTSFEVLKTHLTAMGLLNGNLSPNLVSIMNLTLFAFFINFFVTTLWFLTFTAHTFMEYSQGFYFTVSSLLVLVWYSIHYCQRRKFTELFVEHQAIIEDSKWKHIDLLRSNMKYSFFFFCFCMIFISQIQQEARMSLASNFTQKQMKKLKNSRNEPILFYCVFNCRFLRCLH